MKKRIHYHILSALLLCACCLPAFSQQPEYTNSKEKVYVQTSHVFFKPGETMYFKIYVVNANNQTPSRLSRVVYADIVSPSGNTLQKLNYKVEDGYAEGSFSFSEQATGGIYKIRAYTNWMRNEDDKTFFVREIILQKVIAPRLLMKLDFPEKGYGPGNEVKASFSVRNLSDQPIKNYPAEYTVSIGGVALQTHRFTTNSEGRADIRFVLPAELKTNDGLLNITIHYDSYTEAISRSIPIVLNNIDLQFMPEGGTFVAGVPTNVAFRAVNENGKPVDIKGEVRDGAGNVITSIESYRFGMGRFAFTPQDGQVYTVRLNAPAHTEQSFTLPAVSKNGVVLNVLKANKRVILQLTSTDELPVRLTGETRNNAYYSEIIALKRGENTVDIDESAFPAGIARFTVSTPNGMPMAERLVFMNEERRLQVSITPDKQAYLPRGKVRLTVSTKDENGQPVPSNLSVAVVDDKLWTFADDKQDNILSWLLMSSELHGKIEEPAFYFKQDEPMARPALDLVMLTHGYRYFDYIENVQKEGVMKFLPEQSNILAGVILNSREQPVKADVFLISPAPGEKAARFHTGEDGLFFFSSLSPNSNYYVLAGAMDKKETISIRVLQNGDGYNPLSIPELSRLAARGAHPDSASIAAIDKQRNRKAPLKQPLGMAENRLEEVVVIGYGTQLKRNMTGSVTTISAMNIPAGADIARALEGKVAGVVVTEKANPGEAPAVSIRGMGTLNGGQQPLYILDGIPMESFSLNSLNPADINSITVWKDAVATATYGSRAAYGVIVIESKKSGNERITFDLSPRASYTSEFIKANGTVYSIARKFYAPRYFSHDAHERNDFRETIYWNPVVQTDRTGSAVIEFYNSDASTTFRVIAEGIGYNGKAGRAEQTYAVRSAMGIDAKIPPYLTVGDKALIPLVIKNNGTEPLQISVKLRLPGQLRAGKYDNTATVLPGSSQQLSIPVEATAAVKGNIQFDVESTSGKETLVLPIEATDKGFRVIQTISGNQPGQHGFDIGKIVPGSLKANLQLFTSLEGQLLDGIESMLREPYGCFEQTSSSTYPNIYILKYLKTAGRSNPGVEKRALDYIDRGYKRLVGFETTQNGFEWFGKAPAHEALTAYGLLEFTDMQEFVDVDKKMLDRTRRFLLGRRDGKGSFTLATGGYDRFASVPNKIADIYIVYAMTEAGMGADIVPEYQAALKKALAGNDGYQLALMALAASNMKNDADYNQLMEALSIQYRQRRLASETSVVNSRDASLRVECLSLYALALMRKPQPDIALVADIISKVLGEKSYYGYGATQSTVLALHAIVEYSKLRGRVTEEAGVTFTLNNQPVSDNDHVLTALKEEKNVFGARYSREENTVPYCLEVSYNTLTPPNSDKTELTLATRMANNRARIGETVRMEVSVTNEKAQLQPMTIAKIGIPAGLAVQPWQLKEIMEKNEVAYYEIFDNYLVLYWMGFTARETKKINLDLKAEIAGVYKGKAGTVYLYYTPEYKYWAEGVEADISQ